MNEVPQRKTRPINNSQLISAVLSYITKLP
jgi:hypothetical protein